MRESVHQVEKAGMEIVSEARGLAHVPGINSLELPDVSANQQLERGFGQLKRFERLRAVREQDPDVNRIITRLAKMLASETPIADSGLGAELHISGSAS